MLKDRVWKTAGVFLALAFLFDIIILDFAPGWSSKSQYLESENGGKMIEDDSIWYMPETKYISDIKEIFYEEEI